MTAGATSTSTAPRRWIAGTLTGSLGLLLPSALLADSVLVIAGGERGRGLARPDGETCYVLTPAHVVEPAVAAGEEIQVVGAAGEAGRASLERIVGDAEDDLALLRVTDGGAALCSGEDRERFGDKRGPYLVLRLDNGAFDFVPVAILHEGDRDIRVAALGRGGAVSQMMSGSILVEDGIVKGLLIAEPTAGGKLAEVRSIEFLVERLGAWVRGPAPLQAIDDAQAILIRAVEARPTGDIGQVAAAEALVRSNAGFVGMDLAGLSFAGATLDRGRFAEAVLHGADFGQASLQEADLGRASLEFAELDGARLAGALLEEARLYFAVADGAVLAGARAARSNWTGASARGADFRGANLTGASFHWADLTDADFRDALLTETLFIGAILTGARFEGARIANLDVTAAVGTVEAFDPALRGELCGTPTSHWQGHFELHRTVPDTTSRLGRSLDRIGYEYFPVVEGLRLLDPCRRRTHLPAGLATIEQDPSYERIATRFSLAYPASLLDKADRRSKFWNRFQDQLRRLEAALAARPIITAPGPAHSAITTALTANLTRNAPLTDELWIDPEVLFLLALRHRPEALADYRWQPRAVARLLDEHPFDPPEAPGEPTVWPIFFPAGLLPAQIGPDHVDLFRRWTEARAAGLPSSFPVALPLSAGVQGRMRRLTYERDYEPPLDPFVVSLDELAPDPVPEGLLAGLDGVAAGFEVDRDGDFRYVLAFPEPLDAFRLAIPLETARKLATGKRTAELRVRVLGVEWVEQGDERYLLVRSELLGLRLVGDNGVAFPAELSTVGLRSTEPR